MAACASARTGSGPVPADLVITHVHVVDVKSGRVLPEQTVLIAGNRIVQLGHASRARIPKGGQVVDARGMYLIPGLIETHGHPMIPMAVDAARTTSDTLALLGAYISYGVTGVREAGAFRPNTIRRLVELRGAAESGTLLIPRLYVSGSVARPALEVHDAPDPVDLTRRYIAAGVDGIKLRQGLSNAELEAVISEAGRAGLPAFGHTSDSGRESDPDYTLQAVRWGAQGVMHVLGIAPVGRGSGPEPPALPRFGEENWQAWWLWLVRHWLHTDEGATRTLIDTMVAHGAWLEPTLATVDYIETTERYREHPGNRLLSFPYEEVRSWVPRYAGEDLALYRAAVEQMHAFVRRFYEAGGMVLAGSDGTPAPAVGLHEELRLLVEAGLPPAAALQAATLNAARAFGWEERLGTVSPGKLADLVLLGANPLEDVTNTQKIEAVVLNGRFLDRQALDALLAQAEQAANR